MLLLADKKHCDIAYERDDLKITLKLFIEKFEFQFIKNAVGKAHPVLWNEDFNFILKFSEAVLKQLQTDSIEQLILSFPEQPGILFYMYIGPEHHICSFNKKLKVEKLEVVNHFDLEGQPCHE